MRRKGETIVTVESIALGQYRRNRHLFQPIVDCICREDLFRQLGNRDPTFGGSEPTLHHFAAPSELCIFLVREYADEDHRPTHRKI